MGTSVGQNGKSSLSSAGRARRALKAVKYQPNLTPLIDVLFLLLLFFLLGTQLRHEEGQIPATLSGPGTAGPCVPPVVLCVDVRPVGQWNQDALYEIGGSLPQIGDPMQLGRPLAELKAIGPDVRVVIRPRQDVRWEFVLQALNQAKAANYKDIAFAPAGS